MTIPFGEYQPSNQPSNQLFTPRLRLWLDERLRHLVSQQRIQDARALRGEFSIEELFTRWHFISISQSLFCWKRECIYTPASKKIRKKASKVFGWPPQACMGYPLRPTITKDSSPYFAQFSRQTSEVRRAPSRSGNKATRTITIHKLCFCRIFMLQRSIFFSQYTNHMPTPNHQLDLALIKMKNGKIKMSETTSLSMLIRA